MEIKYIRSIYRFLRDTDIEEIEIEGKEGRIRIKRALSQGQVVSAVEEKKAVEREEEPEQRESRGKNIKVITSPMVGTFYRAPSPEAPPFVEIGSVVKQGQVLCIIEAMKIMNEVESEYGGRVVSILVENGQPVEYGEPLFHIEVGAG